MATVPRLTLVEGEEPPQPEPPPSEAPGDAVPPAESAGQDLCRARQRQDKELADVSRVLKIRREYLSAIEESKLEALPDRAHTIGFVKSYAVYLGLNAKEIVARWKAELAARGDLSETAIESLPQPGRGLPQSGPVIAGQDNPAKPAIDFSPHPESELPRGSWLVAVLLLVGVFYSGYYLSGSSGNPAQQPVPPVPARLAAEVERAPEPVAEPQQQNAEPQQHNVEPQQQNVEPPAAVLPPEPVPPQPTALPPTQPIEVRAQSTPKLVVPLPRGQEYGIANKTSRIILRVHRSTHVGVEGARKHMFIDRVLFPGDTYRVPNIAGVRLHAQDAGAIELILDGSSVGFAGEDGVTAKGLSLNPQSIIARQHSG